MSELTYIVPPRLSGRQDLQKLLDNAYQQGREDKLKECKDALDKSVEMQTFWYEDGYQKGRKDALDEVILRVSEYQDRNKYAFPEKRQKPFESFFYTTTNAILRMIERMKEQKNDCGL